MQGCRDRERRRIALVTARFETEKPKPMVWGAVNGGYHVVGNLLAAINFAGWQ